MRYNYYTLATHQLIPMPVKKARKSRKSLANLNIRVTEAFHAEVKQAADREGLPVSQFVRLSLARHFDDSR
jgi:predicted DNA binding CopG/RHH family protein